MNRRDYILVAEALGKSRPKTATELGAWFRVVDQLCASFKDTHPSFNEQRFREAANFYG